MLTATPIKIAILNLENFCDYLSVVRIQAVEPLANVFDLFPRNCLDGRTKGLVPLPGGIQATYDPTNSGYRIPDWLGNVRFASNSNRTYSSSRAFAPFGERYSSGGSAPSNYTFTGMINGTVSDEYDFVARSLQTSQGRWISPDPAGLQAAYPGNPQSWNRYAYVLNNPLSYRDALGLWCVWEDKTHDDDETDGGASSTIVPIKGATGIRTTTSLALLKTAMAT